MIYDLDRYYFAKIDTVEKAYWLGFITADGNVNKAGSAVCINLSKKDSLHLEKLKISIGSSAPVSFTTSNFGTGVARISLCSKKLVSDLSQYGVVPNKSLKIAPWCGPEIFMPHYWRGVFDGDGSLSALLKGEKRYWRASLNGNHSMVTAFRKFISAVPGATVGYLQPHSSIFKISWGGIMPAYHVVKNILYDANFLALDRKLILAKNLIQFVMEWEPQKMVECDQCGWDEDTRSNVS